MLRVFLGSSWSCDGIVRVAAYCVCVVRTMLVVWWSTAILYVAFSERPRIESIKIHPEQQATIHLSLATSVAIVSRESLLLCDRRHRATMIRCLPR
jgi:hypothetical protein